MSGTISQLKRKLTKAGFTITLTHGGHFKILHRDMSGPVFMSATPSDWREEANLRALIRRKMRAKAA